MYNFTVAMALMDFVPVAFFAVSAVLLLQDLHNKMGRSGYVLLAAGSVNVFMAGFLKALWKLLYAANICDVVVFEQMFLPVNSLGLLFVGLSMIGLLIKKKKSVTLSVAPVPFVSSMPFILMMVVGLGGMCAGLSALAARMKKKSVIALFVASFVCAMGMGFMSSQDSTLAWVNWAEQSINCVSQGCLMAGVLLLHKAGLKEF